MKKKLNGLLIVLSVFINVISLKAQNLAGREIMELVDNRGDGESRKSKITMTLINKRGKKRVREVINISKDYGKDSKSIMIFNKPADVKGTGFLSWDNDDEKKDDARWLYMPALKKIRRISGASNNDYFMGTDFTYDDMGDRNIDEDTHNFIREDRFKENSCYVIESIPKSDDDNYTKRMLWIRKDINMVVKVEYYNEQGISKILEFDEINLLDGIWTAQKLFMNNLQDKHQTLIEISEVEYNNKYRDNLFTVSTIEKGRIK